MFVDPCVVSVADVIVNRAMIVDVVAVLVVMSTLALRIVCKLGSEQPVSIHWAVGNNAL